MMKVQQIVNKIKEKIISTKRTFIREKQVVTIKPTGVSRGNVLVSYIIKPFRNGRITVSSKHTNEWECVKIVSLFLESGYTVDIINFSNDHFMPKKKYSFFLDIHSNMERLSPYLNKDCKKILHITGAHWLFQNTAEYSRLLDIQKKKNATLIPRRMALPSLGIEHCDYATILGNKFTQDTFAYANKPMHRVHISSTFQFEFNEIKDFGGCRKNFLWFGGAGMVLKGLDLVLEAFATMPDYNLNIVGPVIEESDFVELYQHHLYHLPNIKMHGWLNVESSEFHYLVSECIGIILPSCSEGGGGSVITGLHAGLLPIVSYESSVDVFDFGIIIKNLSPEDIRIAVKTIAAYSESELKSMSLKAWQYAREFHTKEKFEEEYRNFIHQILLTKN